MAALNCLSLFLAGIATGFVIVCIVDRDLKWLGIFGVVAAFNLLVAFK